MHDDLLAAQPEGARHDIDICPFCVDKASQSITSRIPPGSAGPDVSDDKSKSTEGGATPTMSDISQETHEALMQKAVADAVKATEAALASKTEEAANAATKLAELESVKADNDRINKELDDAQVQLKTATDKVKSLEEDIAKKDEDSKLAEVASKRAEQVENLKLFKPEYVKDKASKWAALEDSAWDEQIEEWRQLKPVTAEETKETDAASAMSGTDETLTKETKVVDDKASATPSARRAALGLV